MKSFGMDIDDGFTIYLRTKVSIIMIYNTSETKMYFVLNNGDFDRSHLTLVPNRQQTISLLYKFAYRQLAYARTHPNPKLLHIQTNYSENPLPLPSRLCSKSL